MSGFRIEGNTSGNVLEINSSNEAKVSLSQTNALAGYAGITSPVDMGTVTGSRLMRDADTTNDYRLRVATDSAPLFSEFFPGSALNSSIWTSVLNTMATNVSAGFVTLNSGTSSASGASARLNSYRSFPLYNNIPLYMESVIQFAQLPLANSVCEWGLGIAAASNAPSDGVFFRLLADGTFRGITNTGGTEVQTSAINFSSLVGQNITRHFLVSINDDVAEFWIDDVLVGSIARQPASFAIAASQNLPILIRTYNTNITTSAQAMKIGLIGVSAGDVNINKPWAHIRAGAGDMGYQGPTGGTMGSTCLYTNSLAPGAGAAATNTTAALGSGLGGQFSLQPTLTANTDGIISSYQVPAGTALIPGKSLIVTGVHIVGIVETILTGGPILGFWSLAFGHTAVSLATAEAVTTKAPRRIPLGIQTWVATAAVGVQADRDIHLTFQTPIFIQPGEFIQAVLKNTGTVTSAGVITFLITFDSHWE